MTSVRSRVGGACAGGVDRCMKGESGDPRLKEPQSMAGQLQMKKRKPQPGELEAQCDSIYMSVVVAVAVVVVAKEDVEAGGMRLRPRMVSAVSGDTTAGSSIPSGITVFYAYHTPAYVMSLANIILFLDSKYVTESARFKLEAAVFCF